MALVAPPLSFQLLDRLHDGKLRDDVDALAAEGLSIRAIASRLSEQHGVSLSYETLRRWFPHLSQDPAA